MEGPGTITPRSTAPFIIASWIRQVKRVDMPVDENVTLAAVFEGKVDEQEVILAAEVGPIIPCSWGLLCAQV